MDLLALADFNRVASHGGFGKASRMTGRPKASLSRRVAELEAALGVQLIERGPRALRLTEAGSHLWARAEQLLAQIEELGEAVAARSEEPRGKLRISTPVIFGHIALSAIAARFVIEHPAVDIEIVADERYVSPVEEGFDLVVRVNPVPDDRLVGRMFLRDERLVVAPCGMARPEDEQDVAAVVATNQAQGAVWRVGDGGLLNLRPHPVLRLSSLVMVREAVLAGAGAAILPRMLVNEDLKRGRMVMWGALEDGRLDFWALHSSGRMASAKLRAFLNTLVDAFPGQRFPAS